MVAAKSSIGPTSASTSAKPPVNESPRAAARSRWAVAPINQPNDSVWISSNPGTSRGSRTLANESRSGLPGIRLPADAAAATSF